MKQKIEQAISLCINALKLLCIMALQFAAPCFAQDDITSKKHSDLKEFGLKGNIKTIILFRYETEEEFSKAFDVKDTSQWMAKTIVTYNRDGNAISIVTKSSDADGKSYHSTSTTYTYHNHERISLDKLDQDTVGISHRKWLAENVYEEEFADKNGRASYSMTFELQADSKISTAKIKDYEYSGDLLNEYKIVYSFDENDHIIRITTIDKYNKESIEINTDLAFDQNENPTKSVKIKAGRKRKTVIYRTYEYYQ